MYKSLLTCVMMMCVAGCATGSDLGGLKHIREVIPSLAGWASSPLEV